MELVIVLVVVILIGFSGLLAGLTLAMLSIDVYELKRKIRLGNRDAQKVYPLRKDGNRLLCTLIIGNVAVNSALAIFLGTLVNGFFAGLISTVLIVIFGEIIPQAWFSKKPLRVGARASGIVKALLLIFYPVAKPLALALDYVLGRELPQSFSKKEIRVFLDQQRKSDRSELDDDEYEILRGGLIFSDREVKDVMTPHAHSFFIDQGAAITQELLEEVRKRGHSRIPVFKYNHNNVVGLLYVKDIIGISCDDRKLVRNLMRKSVIHVKDTDKLDNVLNKFKKCQVHLFIVQDKDKEVVGVVSLEDVLEQIAGDIVDEHDVYVDMREKKK